MIKIGSVVQTGVFVCGEFKPMWTGEVVDMSKDKSISCVDTGTTHGCPPRLIWEDTSRLLIVE